MIVNVPEPWWIYSRTVDGVGWLGGQTPDTDDMISYYEFIKDIDTAIMEAKTYPQII